MLFAAILKMLLFDNIESLNSFCCIYKFYITFPYLLFHNFRNLVHWNLCQVMYQNPEVQVLFYKNMFPTPFVRCWLGKKIIYKKINRTI